MQRQDRGGRNREDITGEVSRFKETPRRHHSSILPCTMMWLTYTKTILCWGSTTVWPFPCLKDTTSILRSLQGRLAGFHLFKPSFPFLPTWYQPVESDSRRRVPRMFWMDRCVLYIHLPTDSNVMNVGDKYFHFHFLSLCYGRTTPENHKEKKSVKNDIFNNS